MDVCGVHRQVTGCVCASAVCLCVPVCVSAVGVCDSALLEGICGCQVCICVSLCVAWGGSAHICVCIVFVCGYWLRLAK